MIATERRGRSLAGALALALSASPAAVAAGDSARGAKVFQVCAACHSAQPGVTMTGPSLAAMWGRKAGTVPGFGRYSDALKRSGVSWNAATLDAWLRDPAHFIPGNGMPFPGLPSAKDCADVIAFLEALSEGKLAAPRGGMKGELSRAPPDAEVRSIRYCRDTYAVATADGETHRIWDFNLRFKTDASPRPASRCSSAPACAATVRSSCPRRLPRSAASSGSLARAVARKDKEVFNVRGSSAP